MEQPWVTCNLMEDRGQIYRADGRVKDRAEVAPHENKVSVPYDGLPNEVIFGIKEFSDRSTKTLSSKNKK